VWCFLFALLANKKHHTKHYNDEPQDRAKTNKANKKHHTKHNNEEPQERAKTNKANNSFVWYLLFALFVLALSCGSSLKCFVWCLLFALFVFALSCGSSL
jgi:cation transport ATPase